MYIGISPMYVGISPVYVGIIPMCKNLKKMRYFNKIKKNWDSRF